MAFAKFTSCDCVCFARRNADNVSDDYFCGRPCSNPGRYFLSTIYFPLGQGLQLKARRWSNNKTECLHFFKTRDENFRRFEGLQCGHAFWQSTANVEEKDRYVKKIATHYKLFERESFASKYFTEYWNEKFRDPLPTSFYNEETENAPKAGEEFRAFRWDPLLPLPEDISSTAAQNPWIHRASATSRYVCFDKHF